MSIDSNAQTQQVTSSKLHLFGQLVCLAATCFAVCACKKLPDKNSPAPAFPAFFSPVKQTTSAEAFEAFIDNHRGRLIHINTDIDPRLSSIEDGPTAQAKDLFVAVETCKEPLWTLECAGSHYILSGPDYEAQYYNGNNRVSGYFVVDDNVEMHQGTYYMLKSVSAAQVLLHQQ